MKVVHLVAGELSGGAARGAYWLHKAQLELGLDSTIISTSKDTFKAPNIFSLQQGDFRRGKNALLSRIGNAPIKLYRNRLPQVFNTGFSGLDWQSLPAYQNADIIHLHWVNGLVSIGSLCNIHKPVIWTLRDMWPLTGGCHYSMSCEKYKTGCGACPQLGSSRPCDLSRLVAGYKAKCIPENLQVVGVSEWLTGQAKLSSIFKGHDCITILNNIDVSSFNQIDKALARQVLGIESDKKIVLCGATNLQDFYKGFKQFIDCLKFLDTKEVLLCFFGKFDSTLIQNHHFEHRDFGYLNDSISLNLVYAMADVFVAPSTQEAFGKTIVEAMCSGTPVVCFDATGPKDIVVHKVNGYRALPFDPQDLAQGINWIIHANNFVELCKSARDNAVSRFDSKIIAQQYIEIYRKLVSAHDSSLLIVQPWFTAIGHPAQSLLNTASVLGVDNRVSYLIAQEGSDNLFTDLAEQLGQYGHVETFAVPSSSIRTCTLLSLLALLRSRAGKKFRKILFLDAHLVLLAFFWRWVAWLVRAEKLSVIYLMGPEKILNNWLTRKIIKSFLSRPDTKLLLRTGELAEAWRNAFPAAEKNKIDVIPSLELVSMVGTPDSPLSAPKLEFGILGQIRPGKSIERLVPLFTQSPDTGRLTVAGTFINQQHEEALAVLRSYPHFINRYLKEEELLTLAEKQHYLLMLYDDWDARMEAATLYLAARVGRPVIVRASGWCGRMVRSYRCGVICENGDETADFFASLPCPGDDDYAALLSGMARFREEHSGPAWRQAFLDKIFGK